MCFSREHWEAVGTQADLPLGPGRKRLLIEFMDIKEGGRQEAMTPTEGACSAHSDAETSKHLNEYLQLREG